MKKLKKYLLVTAACVFCLAMTGCGNNDNASTSGNNKNDNVVSDAADDVGDAAEDVANGVGDAVDDLVGNGGFENYTDAHDYFLDTMGSYHSDAKFELRDEDQNLNDYQEGSKGYHFYLYDTSKNTEGEMFGEFFVDATSGMIYKKGENGEVSEYPGNTNSTNTNNTNANNNDSANQTNNNTKNTKGTNNTNTTK